MSKKSNKQIECTVKKSKLFSVTVYATKEEKEEIATYANQCGLSVSALMKLAVKSAMKSQITINIG